MIYNLPRRHAVWPSDLDTALEFSSANSFAIAAPKNWDGKLEYTNGNGWKMWDGRIIVSGEIKNNHYIYFRGIGNSKITGAATDGTQWRISGTNIACNGDIDLLLDYSTVKGGNRPSMAEFCYSYMFYGCKSLTTTPSLPATTLANSCYSQMFQGCINLTTAPLLPATTLASSCYKSMFHGCTNLKTAPSLPATTLTVLCYSYMFGKCTNLTTAPSLPATTLANDCYESMFEYCTRLTTAPSLPATTLASRCYSSMFEGCTNLKTAPSLPATTLADYCYYYMFRGCTNLTTAPSLPATTLAHNCYDSMFSSCVSLTTVPSLPATTLERECYFHMFYHCTKIKLSTTASGTYTKAYRIPKSGTGTTYSDSNALDYMFDQTGGTFKGTPEINTTYYLDNSNTIV